MPQTISDFYRLYIDETGNQDLKAAANLNNVRYLSLTGLVFNRGIHDKIAHSRLEQIKSDLFGHSDQTRVVLHRREIMNKTGPFSALQDPHVQEEFDSRFHSLIIEIPFVAFTVSIDKREHLNRYQVWQYDPYHYCLECMLERYVIWLHKHHRKGDVIIEARNPNQDKRLKRAFSHFYRHGNDYVQTQKIHASLTSSQIKFFGKIDNITGLQLADLLAYPAHKAHRLTEMGSRLPNDYGQRLVRSLEKYKYYRNPRNNEIRGWGRKWLP